MFIEPVSGSAPKFPPETLISGLLAEISKSLRIKCSAQGSPIPIFRYFYKFPKLLFI